jgi:hypothetical protein
MLHVNTPVFKQEYHAMYEYKKFVSGISIPHGVCEQYNRYVVATK